MSGLKEQLLKAGLISEQQLKRAQREQRKNNRQQGPQGRASEDAQRRQQALAEKAERDRQLNRQRQEEAQRKALAAQVRQLIETHRQGQGDGDTPFHFVDGKTVKRLYLSPPVREQVVRGQLAIVKLDQRYELVPAAIADKLRQRDPTCIVLQNPPTPPESTPEADDPYAAYRVPDDLVW
ncbi:DUF2058 domain-containing protein [Candidatus Methylocalor cossyra]|uniref:Nucleoprotein/polynucleotide-associated enzyme n=1 Tax=Candidatus Methylocalor cossyra TaxID=3108543 RepID=A0ABM9NKB8_9GAMM